MKTTIIKIWILANRHTHTVHDDDHQLSHHIELMLLSSILQDDILDNLALDSRNKNSLSRILFSISIDFTQQTTTTTSLPNLLACFVCVYLV